MLAELALRSRVTAGVALVGAGLIAVTPAVEPGAKLASVAVRDISLVDFAAAASLPSFPLIGPAGLVSDTAANLSGLVQEFLADPFPIASQTLVNHMTYMNELVATAQQAHTVFQDYVQLLPSVLQASYQAAMSGDVWGGALQLSDWWVALSYAEAEKLISGVTNVTGQMAANVHNVATDTTAPFLILEGMQYPMLQAFNGAAAGVQDVITNMSSGNYLGAVESAALTPTTIVGAVLNGYYGGQATSGYGLLTNPDGALFEGDHVYAGTIYNMMLAHQNIAADLGAKSMSALADPTVAATLSTMTSELTTGMSGLAAALGPALTAVTDLPATLLTMMP